MPQITDRRQDVQQSEIFLFSDKQDIGSLGPLTVWNQTLWGGVYTIVQGREEPISAALEVYTCKTIEPQAYHKENPQM